MSTRRWNHVPFSLSVDISVDGGKFVDERGVIVDAVSVPAGLAEGDVVTLELDCESSGYYDAGKLYGPPEDCYPPEGEDEREVVAARLSYDVGGAEVSVGIRGRKQLDELAERFSDLIEQEEVNGETYEPERYDD